LSNNANGKNDIELRENKVFRFCLIPPLCNCRVTWSKRI